MMDPSTSCAPAPRKMRFKPKIPTKESKLVKPKPEPSDGATNNVIDSKLLNLVKQAEQGPTRRTSKTEKKGSQMQVAFGHVGQRNAARSCYAPRNVEKHQDVTCQGKEYEDPWNYDSYYPTTLPLRLLHIGNPEVLDKAEFGNSSSTYDESLINTAKELELMEDRTDEMLFFQFPASLPLPKRSAAAPEGKKTEETQRGSIKEKGCKLEELPAGFMGKILVYKSGAVKMKLGDSLFDISPGSDNSFAQDVVAINTQMKHCCVLGELNKKAVVTMDLDAIMKSSLHLA